jgi:simple sugar transport system substrate-binding protein
MKTFITSLAAAAALTLAAAGPVSAQSGRIIVVSHGQANDPFWSVVKNGVTEAGKDMGVQVDYRAPETFDMVAMGQLIDAAVNQKPAGLVVSIPDASALGPSIKKAVAAGIPVISMNSGSDVSKSLGALLHVGQDESEAGRVAGARLKELGGKVGICINHEVGNVSLDKRCEGFAQGFGGKTTVLPVSTDPADNKAKVKAALASDPSIDTVLALNATLTAEPAVAATKEAGKSGMRIATFDMSSGFLKSVAAGEATFAIDQQQYLQGYLPVAFLALNGKYGLVPGGNVPSGPNLVTKEKAGQVVELSAKGIR